MPDESTPTSVQDAFIQYEKNVARVPDDQNSDGKDVHPQVRARVDDKERDAMRQMVRHLCGGQDVDARRRLGDLHQADVSMLRALSVDVVEADAEDLTGDGHVVSITLSSFAYLE